MVYSSIIVTGKRLVFLSFGLLFGHAVKRRDDKQAAYNLVNPNDLHTR